MLPQFDSVKVPVPGGKAVPLLDLLAQARIKDWLKFAKKLVGEVAGLLAPAASGDIEEGARSVAGNIGLSVPSFWAL